MADPGTSPRADVVVSVIETATAVGLTAAQTAAAIRAGISGFVERDGYEPIPADDDDEPVPLIAATHGLVTHDGWERLVDLLIEPLAAAIAAAALTRAEMARTGLYFALPYADAVVAKLELERTFFPAVRARLGLPPVPDLIGTQTGGVGPFALLERARDKIAAGELDVCVIAAADSYLLPERLEHYDEAWRLKTSRNPSGFVPGEAGGVLVVERAARAAARSDRPRLRIAGCGRKREPNPIEGTKSSTGIGLATAIRAACAEAGASTPIRWVLSDLDGERYKAFEWGIALPRLGAVLDPGLVHWHPADCIGNVGAAAVAVHLACVAAAFSRGYAPADSALVLGASDGGQRAAMIVEAA